MVEQHQHKPARRSRASTSNHTEAKPLQQHQSRRWSEVYIKSWANQMVLSIILLRHDTHKHTKGWKSLFDHHLVIDQVTLVKMANHPEMNQTIVHGYANQSNDSIFQMEIGRKPSPILTQTYPDYTSPLKPSDKSRNICICKYFQHQKLLAIKNDHLASIYPFTASQQRWEIPEQQLITAKANSTTQNHPRHQALHTYHYPDGFKIELGSPTVVGIPLAQAVITQESSLHSSSSHLSTDT